MSSPANMYRVGDYVFFEINTSSPYQIRRIEELNKTPSGNVEAKVMCFYRRRDIGAALLKVIDGRQAAATNPDQSSAKSADTIPKSTTDEGDKSDASVGVKTEGEETTPEKPEKVESAEKMDVDTTPTKETAESKSDAITTTTGESTTPKPTPTEEPTAESTKKDDEPAVEKKLEETGDEPPTAEAKPEESTGESKIEIVEAEKREKTPEKTIDTSTSSSTSAAAADQSPSDTAGVEKPLPGATSAGVAMPGEEKLSDTEKHRLLHRELFLSRQIETLPATHIRGKCTVTLLNELETPESYFNKEDAFFYSLVYDPAQKTILADKGEIRVGDKYQAQVPEAVLSEDERKTDRADVNDLETMIFHPHHGLTEREIDQFLLVSKAVGTLARAFDMSSANKYTGLHTTVAAASRDVTLFQGMVLLHQASYDIGKATGFLVPPAQKQWFPADMERVAGHTMASLGGPLMCRDQMEEWSAAESNLFEEALEKYGKDFNDIRQDFLPWKSLKDIVEYYYMWKTTDRYIQQKRVKAAEAESRLKQVYIPTYAKPNPNAIQANNTSFKKCCEGCAADNTEQWFAWGPASAQLRLCKDCWNYWKKYGGLKKKHKLENFDKLMATQPQDVQSGMIMPRPGDRLVEMSDFGGRVQRCSLPGCSMQFANLQTLNQHLRRDHGLPWTGSGGESAMGHHTNLRPPHTTFGAAGGGPMQLIGMQTGPMRNGPRTRAPVFLRTTLFTKAARRLAPKQLHNPRHAARNPFDPINAVALRAYTQSLQPQKISKMARVLVKMGLATASTQAAAAYTTSSSSSSSSQKPQQQQHQQQQQHHHQQQQQQQQHAHQASTVSKSSASSHGHGGMKQAHPNVATVAPIQRHQQQMPQKRPHGGSSGGMGGGGGSSSSSSTVHHHGQQQHQQGGGSNQPQAKRAREQQPHAHHQQQQSEVGGKFRPK